VIFYDENEPEDSSRLPPAEVFHPDAIKPGTPAHKTLTRNAIRRNEKQLEVLIERITRDIRSELDKQMEQIIRYSVNKAVSDALEKSSQIIRKAMLDQLSNNLSPIVDLIIEDIESEQQGK
jgi:hypothetical protein